jgi:hypothetical protein
MGFFPGWFVLPAINYRYPLPILYVTLRVSPLEGYSQRIGWVEDDQNPVK